MTVRWVYRGKAAAIAVWQRDAGNRNPSDECHKEWHTLEFMHAGACVLIDSRGSTLIDPTRVAFFNPHESYRMSHPLGFLDLGASFAIRDDVVAAILGPRISSARSTVRFEVQTAPITGRCYLRQRRLLRAWDRGDIDHLGLEEETLRLAADVVAEAYPALTRCQPPIRIGPSRRREVVETIRRALAADICAPHTIDSLAAFCGLSSFHICRVFRSETGNTIHRYLNQLRLRAALESLEGRRGRLIMLAGDFGFSSHSHFTAAFRREFGVTPTQALCGNTTHHVGRGVTRQRNNRIAGRRWHNKRQPREASHGVGPGQLRP